MSACHLKKLNHMFVISNNTWQECGILGKRGERKGQYILGQEGNGDNKIDPIFINRTWTAGLCVLLGVGQTLLKKYIYIIESHSQISLYSSSNIKIPDRDQI